MEFIKVIDNFLSSESCNKLVKIFESNPSQHFQGYFGSNKKVEHSFKKCQEMYIDQNLESVIIEQLKPLLDNYADEHMIGGSFMFERFRIKKYLNDGKHFFKQHTDISSIKNCNRILAVIIYLNDVKQGGETVISLSDKKVGIRPKTGSVLMFPANFCFPHEGRPPISNNKYILVTFINYS